MTTENKTLASCKEQIAFDNGFTTWKNLTRSHLSSETMEAYTDMAHEVYRLSQVTPSDGKCPECLGTKVDNEGLRCLTCYVVASSSVTTPNHDANNTGGTILNEGAREVRRTFQTPQEKLAFDSGIRVATLAERNRVTNIVDGRIQELMQRVYVSDRDKAEELKTILTKITNGGMVEWNDGWVDVKDRLPENSGHYVIYEEVSGDGSVFSCYLSDQGKWWYNDQICYPTHWRKLPQPPQTKKGEAKK